MRDTGSIAGLVLVVGCLAVGGGAAAQASSGAPQLRARVHPSSAQGLDVLPFPGTPDAAPATNIDFPAVSVAHVASVIVVGSRSGLHAGRLSAQPAGHGSAFSPDRRFAPGERVSVTATFRSAAAGTASGAPGRKQISFSFTVARPATVTERAAPDGDGLGSGPTRPAVSSSKTHSFVTQPGFHVPWVKMHGGDTDTGSGDILLNAGNSGQHAAYILDPKGTLLWYQPTASHGDGPGLFNTRVQSYQGHRVITYWEGDRLYARHAAVNTAAIWSSTAPIE